ncbi:MAG: LAS superfamily LD-carboxypeptidase LdcB [Oceanicoccus sp.]|jgi:LAS superfamily LD-carboxypeptidase LdcB
MRLNDAHIYGLDDEFIVRHDLGFSVHRDIVEPFMLLRTAAQAAGFELAIASGYRDFERQLAIWNAKASGQRTVLDSDGEPLDLSELDPWEQVQAILRWSALPGASRHHWGTDIDVYDKAAVAGGYSVQLTDQEVFGDGPFAPLHGWLDRQIADTACCFFFRPYQTDTGGIAPERWHLSYRPLAEQYQSAMSIASLHNFISEQPIKLKNVLLAHVEEIFFRFISVENNSL